MAGLKKLWGKWWFVVPISFVLSLIGCILVFGLIFGVSDYNVGRMTFLVWLFYILNRYWWSKKKHG